MQGNFEQIIPLQDALNKVVSDSVNDWESFVDSYLVLEGMQGTTPEDIAEMKANRVLLTDADSKAYWLTKQADNDRVKTMQDDLRTMILELGNVPDMQDITGLSVSGEAMKFRLTKTEIQASRIERIVTRGIQRKVELLYKVLSLTGDNMAYTEVVPVFTRNFIMGESNEVTE
jgi:SPP1 family phage portal protein